MNAPKLLKKIDQARLFIEQHRELFQCPYCQSVMMIIEGYSVLCAKGHRFDFSKKGTLFLVKHRVKSDYDQQELWRARRNVLQSDFFAPILEQILAHMPHRPLAYLDVGCGEGTSLAYIRSKRTQFADAAIGFDISKDAINLATQQQFDSFFCIADLAALPFASQKLDAIIDILSPSAYQEFDRVLKDDGQLFKVVPNSSYLIELRHRLYRPEDPQYSYQNTDVIDRIMDVYPQTEVIPIKYQFDLTPKLADDLLKMTPLQWGSQAITSGIFDQPLTYVTVDMSLLIVRKNCLKSL